MAPITFGSVGLQGEDVNNPTSLEFSKAGHPVLYVSQQDGTIWRLEIEAQADGPDGDSNPEFVVTDATAITVLKDTVQNYNDEGTLNNFKKRQITGITTDVDEDGNDVLYVGTSDWRIAVGNDVGLDTNSGQIHKLVLPKSYETESDIIENVALLRGLPRSEENHSVNGLEIHTDATTGAKTLWIAQGGNTNKGAPGNNFAGTVDFTLSGTVLKVDLDALESYDTRIDAHGEAFKLDLPTLDDPTRENVDLVNDLGLDPSEIPANFTLDKGAGGDASIPDFAGGNNGLNQAKIVKKVLVQDAGTLTFVDNPLVVHQSGHRNNYDVVVTSDGEVFSWDNGPNGGWGGQPKPWLDSTPGNGTNWVTDWENELATNEFNENGSEGFGDQLHYAGNVDDAYGPYAGAANPIRAAKAILDAAFKTNGDYKPGDPDAPVLDGDGSVIFANEAEARDYLAKLLIIYTEQSNGNWVDSNAPLPADLHDIVSGYDWKHPGSSIGDPTKHFDGPSIMAGTKYSPESQTFAPDVDGSLRTINSSTNGLAEYTATFFEGALQGALVAAAFDGKLYIQTREDTDGDGRTDAVTPVTTIGGFGSQPLDVVTLGNEGIEGFSVDNIGGPNGTGDGIDDFAGLIVAVTYGADNLTFFVPGGQPADASTDLDLDGIDNVADAHVGDPTNGKGVMVNGGETQTWQFELNNPDSTPDGAKPKTGDSIAGDIGLNAVLRNNVDKQVAQDGFALFDPSLWNLGGASTFVSIDQADDGTAEGTSNDQTNVLGVGFAAPSGIDGIIVKSEMLNIFDYALNKDAGKTWDGGEKAGIVVGPGDQSNFVEATTTAKLVDGQIVYGLSLLVDDNDVTSSTFVEMPGLGTADNGQTDGLVKIQLEFDFTGQDGPKVFARASFLDNGSFSGFFETATLDVPAAVVSAIKGQANNQGKASGAVVGLMSSAETGDDSFAASWDFIKVQGVGEGGTDGQILYRWNAGNSGPVAAVDGGPDWVSDTGPLAGGPTKVGTFNITGRDSGLPLSVPEGIFAQERWDPPGGGNMKLAFGEGALDSGSYAVRLFLANGFGGTSGVGERVFDIKVEGQVVADDFDPVASFGHQTGGMLEWVGAVTDGTININFLAEVENPVINGVEIIKLGDDSAAPVISVVGASVLESYGSVLVTIQSDVPVPAGDTVTVTYEIVPVDASPQSDYAAPGLSFDAATGVYTGTGEIAGNSADFTLPVEILNDALGEGEEAFEVRIVSVSGAQASIGTDTATVTILDDDGGISPGGGGGDVLYRVNVGGPTIVVGQDDATSPGDSALDWSGDSGNFGAGGNSPYLAALNTGKSTYSSNASTSYPGAPDTSDSSIPDGTPDAIFATERYDLPGQPNMKWTFPVGSDHGLAAGDEVVVRLYFAELFSGVTSAGERVFDVQAEGSVPSAFDDVDAYAQAGANAGFMRQATVTIGNDGDLDLTFLRGIENPALKGIEILQPGGGSYSPPVDDLFGQKIEISDNRLAPSDAGTLKPGNNILIAQQEGESSDNGIRDRDYFTFEVPQGYGLTKIKLRDFTTENFTLSDGFFAIQEGNQITVDPLTGQPDPGTGPIKGGMVYGLGNLGSGNNDLLNKMSAGGEIQPGFALPAFDTPLTGQISGWLNQGVGPSVADLNFVVEPLTTGSARLGITEDSNNVQISNFGVNSFQLENTGSKKITKVAIDVAKALYPDTVFDPFGVAGDTVAKPLTINSAGNTGVLTPTGNQFDQTTIGTTYKDGGGIAGFEKIVLEFSTTQDGGFQPGETLGFSVDMDPNSIAGSKKSTLDGGTTPFWDVGGVSGAELIGSSFTVTFEDGSSAKGQLTSAGNQAGARGQAVEGQAKQSVTLTVNGLSEGGVGTYSDGGPTVIVDGPAGQTARIVLTKGIVQPTENNFTGAYKQQFANQIGALEASDFPANNAAWFQTVDVVLTGSPQNISSQFNFTTVPGFALAVPEDELPLGFVASVIDPDNDDLPLGNVTDAIYVTHTDAGALEIDPITKPAASLEGDTVQFAVAARDPQDDPIDLSVTVTEKNGPAVPGSAFSFDDAGDGTGTFSWQTGKTDSGTYVATVTAEDGTETATETVEFTVANNTAPELGPISVPDTQEDAGPVLIDLLSTATDPEGRVLTVTQAQASSSNGAREVEVQLSNGVARIDPAQFGDLISGQSETVTLDYAISDGLNTSNGSLSFSVSGKDDGNLGSDGIVGEAGTVSVTQGGPDEWFSVTFETALDNPSVVMGPISANGTQPATMRVREVTNTGFQYQLDEWDYLDGGHTAETVGWLAVETGTHTLADGRVIQAGQKMTGLSGGAVTFASDFAGSKPVVVAQVASHTGATAKALTDRVDQVTKSGFAYTLQDEEAGTGNLPQQVRMDWIALSQGSGAGYVTDIKSGVTNAKGGTLDFASAFGSGESPVLLADMQTKKGSDTATVRATSLDSDGAKVFIEEEKSADSEVIHAAEDVGYAALRGGQIVVSGNPNIAPVLAEPLDDLGILTGQAIDVKLPLSSSFFDADRDPMTFEASGLPQGLSMNANGRITGTTQAAGDYTVTITASDGEDTGSGSFDLSVNTPAASGDAVGEIGKTTITQSGKNAWTSVAFSTALDDPAVVMGPLTHDGGAPALVRVRNVTETGFEFQLDEWDYLDGAHVTESLSWIAVSQGVHTLQNGITIEAGHKTGVLTDKAVSLAGEYSSKPVILGQTAGDRVPEALASRINNVSTDGFTFRFQEEEAGDGTLDKAEDFDWIAVEQGMQAGLKSSTGKQIGTTPGQTNFADLFEGADAPALIADIQTIKGADPVGLRLTELTNAGAGLFLEEEKSADSETTHANETLGYLAAEPGLLFV